MNFYIDLDGTLVDSRQRQYEVFSHILGGNKISFEEYWDLKRNRISQAKLLQSKFGMTHEQCMRFNDEWMDLIETDEFLVLDKIFPNVDHTLNYLKGHGNLHLVTARQNEYRVQSQLADFNIQIFFESVLVTRRKTSKLELVVSNCCVSSVDYFIGDTGEDINTGKALGVNTVAATYGTLSKAILEEYAPNYLIDDISQMMLFSFDAKSGF